MKSDPSPLMRPNFHGPLPFGEHINEVSLYFRSLLRNLTGEQYEDVINVCSMFPAIDMVVKAHGESIS